jgi:hypothetical protein
MPWPKESLAEQHKAWKNVVKTTIEEGNKAGAVEKERWLEAQKLAEEMVGVLATLVKMEKKASKMFFAARAKKPMLKLVVNGE